MSICTGTLVEIINEIIKLTKDKKIVWEKNEHEYYKQIKLDKYDSSLLNRRLSISKSNVTWDDVTKLKMPLDDSIYLDIDTENVSHKSRIFSNYTSNPVQQLYNLVTTGHTHGQVAISFEKFLSDIKSISSEKQ
jgi:hypothetical protein